MSTFINFEEHMRAHGLAERTLSEYGKWVRRMLRWMREHGYTDDLTASQLREWGSTLPKSWASRKQARSVGRPCHARKRCTADLACLRDAHDFGRVLPHSRSCDAVRSSV